MLQPGDILLYRIDPGAPLIDRLIGWGERRLGDQKGLAGYYHVSFVSPNPKMMYQAKPPRVCLSPIPDPLPSYIEVYRLIKTPTPEGLARMFAYADSRLGKLYDFIGVLTAGFIEVGGLEYCSQLFEDAAAQIPVLLCPDVRRTLPDDIAYSLLIARLKG